MSAEVPPLPLPPGAGETITRKVRELFARVEAYAEQADFERALECLAAGESICGGLTPGYLVKRVRWTAILAAQGG